MNTENAIASCYDDVVFENRNKTYGAYSIRKAYDSNLSKGSVASFLFFIFLFGLAYAAMMLRSEIKKIIVEPPVHKYLTDIKIIPDQPLRNEIEKPRVKQSNDFPTRVMTEEVIDKPPVDPQTSTTSIGENKGTTSINSRGEIGVELPITPTVIDPPKTVDFAEVMPEFEGGVKELYKFLRKTLRYPRVAQHTGQEGTVFVRFTIDVTGAVTGVEVIRGIDGTLDKEASRVIGLMPNWKPGMQHGMPVNVRMVLPIKFEINRE